MMRLWRGSMIVPLFFCFTGLAANAGAQAANAARSAASTDQRGRFVGTYRYAGGTEEDEARKAAIDGAVRSMSALTRSAARNRISATTQIPGFYTFSSEPGKIKVLPEARPEMISGDKGEAADYVYNGKTSKLTQVIAGDRLTQVFLSADGKRENEFTLSQGGKALTLKVTVTSPRLSTPVVYNLSYRRAD